MTTLGTILQIIGLLALALTVFIFGGFIWLLWDNHRQQKAHEDALYAGLHASLMEYAENLTR